VVNKCFKELTEKTGNLGQIALNSSHVKLELVLAIIAVFMSAAHY